MGSIQVQRLYNGADPAIRVFVTEGGTVYESTDKGGSWLNTGGTGNGTLCLFGNKLYTGGNGISVADSILTGITNIDAHRVMPTTFSLSQNYPNPFNPTTVIRYQLAASIFVDLSIYDMLGRKIKTLVSERQSAGIHSVTFNAGSLSSGVYFYRLTAGSFVDAKKLLVLK
jgi:hypothetical protein